VFVLPALGGLNRVVGIGVSVGVTRLMIRSLGFNGIYEVEFLNNFETKRVVKIITWKVT
jgi:hypothetical protein